MRRFLAFTAALTCFALSNTPTRAGGGPECWRRGGPPALAAMMTEHADAIRRCREGNPVENWTKISADLDAVAAQRDAWASGLYWYTDLDDAKAAAKREGKPILSLRLLGRLDQELSCANSRYFRTTLYPAAAVSGRLRERFVLHWSSERPAPVVTVDFGDGRTLRRTVTGNSAHYLMTSDGDVVDVLPGLYSAKAFAAWLDDAGAFATRVATTTPSDHAPALRAYHVQKRADLDQRWAADQRAVGATRKPETIPTSLIERQLDAKANDKPAAGAVPAKRAAGLAIAKGAGEFPVVALLSVADPSAADEQLWSAIANLHLEDAKLDADAVAVMRCKRPAGGVEGVLPALQRTIAQDTVRNEYTLHRTIHSWFAGGDTGTSFEKLNERVYAQLFLTPRSDPWLGLAPANAWSGLDDDGLSAVAAR